MCGSGNDGEINSNTEKRTVIDLSRCNQLESGNNGLDGHFAYSQNPTPSTSSFSQSLMTNKMPKETYQSSTKTIIDHSLVTLEGHCKNTIVGG